MRSFREIQQNNKLIAEFIGGKVIDEIWSFPDFPIKETCIEGDFPLIDLDFDEDWNKLMLVIDFIDMMEGIYNLQIVAQPTLTVIWLDYEEEPYEFTHGSYDRLECLYNCVIKLIKWYNTLKNE